MALATCPARQGQQRNLRRIHQIMTRRWCHRWARCLVCVIGGLRPILTFITLARRRRCQGSPLEDGRASNASCADERRARRHSRCRSRLCLQRLHLRTDGWPVQPAALGRLSIRRQDAAARRPGWSAIGCQGLLRLNRRGTGMAAPPSRRGTRRLEGLHRVRADSAVANGSRADDQAAAQSPTSLGADGPFREAEVELLLYAYLRQAGYAVQEQVRVPAALSTPSRPAAASAS